MTAIVSDSARHASANEIVGERVHRVMWRQKVSQTQLAPHLGLTQSALSRKLRGARAFGIDELLTIAEQLSVEVADLIDRLDPWAASAA